ncbi:Mog1p/PsbP-like protein [Coccomyxa subellipsoidea C-169]|uniref:Mog1p/PsbP-like protein n=1 Tax=Coccomyxa subellipsoidea (strain C-169) TaxID=574566 RepID=I0YU49_COCSC|nr:Mog1p/PsbP-like protein [Coccomyxa subellipsoidea C-169]EIE21918.1 Mog1p/PsbP-like protein [Coccomyxa subellipsoidea C-169]|eukprot:XP_005646462.1 Mog1p/PsbP-like protein [Coccomyxa subellipsoidea C-169]
MIVHNPLLCKLQNYAPYRIAPLGASHRKQSIDVTIRAKTESPVPIRRRQALSILFMTASTLQTAASDAETETSQFQTYSSPKQGYKFQIPSDWQKTEKSGADVLFVEPASKAGDIGVTVSPVRIKSLEQFGDLTAVGDRLLAAERSKESTEYVNLLSSASRRGENGTLIYSYDYKLDTSRGKKRVISTVAVAGQKLYILNGTVKCSKPGPDCSPLGGPGVVESVQAASSSFDILAVQ